MGENERTRKGERWSWPRWGQERVGEDVGKKLKVPSGQRQIEIEWE